MHALIQRQTVWRMKCSCQLGVAYTHCDLGKLSLAFLLGAGCRICIWKRLWEFRFMSLWLVPGRAFFDFLSAPFSLHFVHSPTPLQFLFTRAELERILTKIILLSTIVQIRVVDELYHPSHQTPSLFPLPWVLTLYWERDRNAKLLQDDAELDHLFESRMTSWVSIY